MEPINDLLQLLPFMFADRQTLVAVMYGIDAVPQNFLLDPN